MVESNVPIVFGGFLYRTLGELGTVEVGSVGVEEPVFRSWNRRVIVIAGSVRDGVLRDEVVASDSNTIGVADAPGASRIRDLAGNVLETLRAAQVQIRSESTDLQTQRDLLAQEHEQLAKSQKDLAKVHKEIETKFSELAQASNKLNQLRMELQSSREELDSERLALCGERVRQVSPDTAAHEVALPREHVLVHDDRAVAKISSHRSREPVPKPASNDAALQFRKLRRDAKRKAVGV